MAQVRIFSLQSHVGIGKYYLHFPDGELSLRESELPKVTKEFFRVLNRTQGQPTRPSVLSRPEPITGSAKLWLQSYTGANVRNGVCVSMEPKCICWAYFSVLCCYERFSSLCPDNLDRELVIFSPYDRKFSVVVHRPFMSHSTWEKCILFTSREFWNS